MINFPTNVVLEFHKRLFFKIKAKISDQLNLARMKRNREFCFVLDISLSEHYHKWRLGNNSSHLISPQRQSDISNYRQILAGKGKVSLTLILFQLLSINLKTKQTFSGRNFKLR